MKTKLITTIMITLFLASIAFNAVSVHASPTYVVEIDPMWMRTTDYFIENFPYLTYYADDLTYGPFTWTTDAWNGPSTGIGGLIIPDYVSNDYWFYTLDYGEGAIESDGAVLKGTYYWFKAEITILSKSLLTQVKMFDKYHLGKITVNDGLIVFVNGVPQINNYLSVSEPYGTGRVYDPVIYPSDHWAFNELLIPLGDFVEGTNEVAVLFEERYGDGGLGHLMFEVTYSALPVIIDIKPGSYPNSICLSDQGLLPVAILGSESFDVTTIDPTTIMFGTVSMTFRGSAKAPKLAYSFEDVNEDGYIDLIAFFSVPELVTEGVLTETTTELKLTANLYDTTPIAGTDSVRVVPP